MLQQSFKNTPTSSAIYTHFTIHCAAVNKSFSNTCKSLDKHHHVHVMFHVCHIYCMRLLCGQNAVVVKQLYLRGKLTGRDECHEHRGVRDLLPTPVGSQEAHISTNNIGFDRKHATRPYCTVHTHTPTLALSLAHAHKRLKWDNSAERMPPLSSGGCYGQRANILHRYTSIFFAQCCIFLVGDRWNWLTFSRLQLTFDSTLSFPLFHCLFEEWRRVSTAGNRCVVSRCWPVPFCGLIVLFPCGRPPDREQMYFIRASWPRYTRLIRYCSSLYHMKNKDMYCSGYNCHQLSTKWLLLLIKYLGFVLVGPCCCVLVRIHQSLSTVYSVHRCIEHRLLCNNQYFNIFYPVHSHWWFNGSKAEVIQGFDTQGTNPQCSAWTQVVYIIKIPRSKQSKDSDTHDCSLNSLCGSQVVLGMTICFPTQPTARSLHVPLAKSTRAIKN